MKETPSLFAPRAVWVITLILILSLGLAIRFYDANDLPLDFHSTRQMLSVIKARGMYYDTRTGITPAERTFAIQQWKLRASIEPSIMERIVAYTYRFTGEQHWVARAYTSLFWIIGAIFLFLLARRLTSTDGALAAAAFYLFLPYAIIASRSFQPDPLMVTLIILFWWSIYEWSLALSGGRVDGVLSVAVSRPGSWLFAILAGLFGGLAILIKLVAAFFIIGGGIGVLLLGRKSLTEVLKQPQVYVMSVLGILPGAAYIIYGVWVAGYLGQQFGRRFIPTYFLSPSYYLGWVNMLNIVIGGIPLMIALLGIFFFDNEKRRFILALWAGYGIFGLYFNYHIASHDYYSLPLIPIAALSIAPLADKFFTQLKQLTLTRLLRISFFCILLVGLFMSLWSTRNQLNSVDYRPQTQMWVEIGKKMKGYDAAGLTQDYGARIAYWGWTYITSWPTYGDLIYHDDLLGAKHDFEKQFAELAENKDLFIVTDFADMDRQPFLKEKLKAYPIFAEGDGYVIYNMMDGN